MAAKFNSPPGWPTPPEGWTPPPGWAPDPSWPAAPQGWQFWIDDAAGAPPPGAGQPDPYATQTIGTSPTQVLPGAGAQNLYSYAPSTGLEQPGASPYSTPPQGAPPGSAPGGPYGSPGAPAPRQRNTAVIVGVVVVAALVLGGIVWGITSLLSGGGDPDPTATQTTEPATSDPATTDEPTDPATTDAGGGGDVADLTGDEPALVMGYVATEPIAELRLQQVVYDWQPTNDFFCSGATQGQYLGLEFEITTTQALSQEDPPTYNFLGWEIGAELDGAALEASGIDGMLCLDASQQAPEMGPGETATGWVVLDVPENVTAVTYANLFDFTGEAPKYRWVLAEQ